MNQISGFFGEYRFLSNFDTNPHVKIMLDNVGYSTIEHAFQAAKTLDADERLLVEIAHSPGKAKKLGGPKEKGGIVTLRSDWENIKIDLMIDFVHQKFAQDPYKELLLNTGDAELIEGNTWNDTFWGVCDGVGKNWLGKILMTVREELQSRHD